LIVSTKKQLKTAERNKMSSELSIPTPDDAGIILNKQPDGRGEIKLMARDGSV